MKFNESTDTNYLGREEEENGYSTFLGGWLTLSNFLGGWSNFLIYLGG